MRARRGCVVDCREKAGLCTDRRDNLLKAPPSSLRSVRARAGIGCAGSYLERIKECTASARFIPAPIFTPDASFILQTTSKHISCNKISKSNRNITMENWKCPSLPVLIERRMPNHNRNHKEG